MAKKSDLDIEIVDTDIELQAEFDELKLEQV